MPRRFAALALSPRAAVVLAVVVVVVALVVVVLGAWSGARRSADGGGVVTVTGGPTSGSGSGSGSASGAGSPTAVPTATPSAVALVVHVVGAVERPGVVTLGSGSRVSVALERAGGATADADLARLNLARLVQNGERLYVPRVGETDIPAALDAETGVGAGSTPGGSSGDGPGAADGPDAVVDLNTADQTTLETLPGIGPALAGRILAWREEHGRFAAVEDLLDVSGIGDGRFADLRERVRV